MNILRSLFIFPKCLQEALNILFLHQSPKKLYIIPNIKLKRNIVILWTFVGIALDSQAHQRKEMSFQPNLYRRCHLFKSRFVIQFQFFLIQIICIWGKIYYQIFSIFCLFCRNCFPLYFKPDFLLNKAGIFNLVHLMAQIN